MGNATRKRKWMEVKTLGLPVAYSVHVGVCVGVWACGRGRVGVCVCMHEGRREDLTLQFSPRDT